MEQPADLTLNVTVASRPWKLRLSIGLVSIAVLGTAATVLVGHLVDQRQREDLFDVANLVRYSVDPSVIDQLAGDETDLAKPVYQDLHRTFVELGNATRNIRYIYLMGRTDQAKVFFYLDSQPERFNLPDQPALAVPGEEYTEVTAAVSEVFDHGTSSVVGPKTDKWGTFISALLSVRDSTNTVVALLGIDVDATDHIADVRSRQYIPLVATIFLLMLYAIIILLPLRGHPLTKPEQN